MSLIKHCAGWLRTKTGMLVAVGLIAGIIAIERSVGGALLAGAAPLLMLLACIVPCAVPLLLLRRREKPAAAQSACGCGDPGCGASESG